MLICILHSPVFSVRSILLTLACLEEQKTGCGLAPIGSSTAVPKPLWAAPAPQVSLLGQPAPPQHPPSTAPH